MKMTTALLSLAVVIICIAAAQSSPFPNLMNEKEDLNTQGLLELQEQGPLQTTTQIPTTQPVQITCLTCVGDCTDQVEEVCPLGFDSCATVEAFNVQMEKLTVKVCTFRDPMCNSPEMMCDGVNTTFNGDVESCKAKCCFTDRCNEGPITPPTTPAPTTIPVPTIACGRAFSGTSGNFASPGFPGNYPPNLDCTWTITNNRRSYSCLVLAFRTIDTEYQKDIITITGGGRTYRLSGKITRGRRNSCCDNDDDEGEDDDDYVGDDTANNNLAGRYAHYLYDRRQGRRPVREICIGLRRQKKASINFKSDSNDSGQRGFQATFRLRRAEDRR